MCQLYNIVSTCVPIILSIACPEATILIIAVSIALPAIASLSEYELHKRAFN